MRLHRQLLLNFRSSERGVISMQDFLAEFFPDVARKEQSNAPGNQYCKFNSQILTTFTSSLYIAGLLASFVASTVTRLYGRKPSMLTGGISFLVGAGLNGGARNLAMLIVGRILLGVGVGFANQAVPVYLSETHSSPLHFIEPVQTWILAFIFIGSLSSAA